MIVRTSAQGCLRNQAACLRPLLARRFTVAAPRPEKPLPPRLVISEADISEVFLKGTGPGGQKINKTSSAVQLKHLPTGLVVKNQETRSRDQNRKNARRILAERLEAIEKGSESRTAIKAERARKKKASASKKTRRKYRKLEEEKNGETVGENEHEFHDKDNDLLQSVDAEKSKTP